MGQAVVNIGMVGHVDHGKTTLLSRLTGKWADTHSEERKRGITIKLGYASVVFKECVKCGRFVTIGGCPCGGELRELRKVSFVDAPGHETLMATMLSGAAIMDGALLLVAANEGIREQTKEHLLALEVLQVKNVVVVQNKIDLVSEEEALKSFREIKQFLKGTIAENAPIIPVSAEHGANIDVLLEFIHRFIPTPERDLSKPPLLLVARSFDVNKPGTSVSKLVGGVLGGALLEGKLRVGDVVEILPGFKSAQGFIPLVTRVVSLDVEGENLDEVVPGGTVGVGTELDPFLTKSDRLSGCVLGLKGELPSVKSELELSVNLFSGSIVLNESFMLTVWTARTVGVPVRKTKNGWLFDLKLPVVARSGERVAISKLINNRWTLIGYGVVQ